MKPYRSIDEKVKKRKIPEYPDMNEKSRIAKKVSSQPSRKVKLQPERNGQNTKYGNRKTTLPKEQDNNIKSTPPELNETKSERSASGTYSQKKTTLTDKVKSKGTFNEISNKLNVLYFSMPENDGSFLLYNGESSNDGRKYYRLEYIDGSETGVLYFISGDRDKRAINMLESYLKPVCDIENIENADSVTNIEFKNPGKVSLRNDSWVIDSDNKVQIKLY